MTSPFPCPTLSRSSVARQNLKLFNLLLAMICFYSPGDSPNPIPKLALVSHKIALPKEPECIPRIDQS